MLVYLFALLLLALLVLLYRYLPNRRAFACFCLTLALAGLITYTCWPGTQPAAELSEEQRYDIQQQQQIFAVWYGTYQKNLKQLDHNWRWYHQILEEFKEDNISIQTACVRLKQLEEEEKALTLTIANDAPPLALHDACYDLATAVFEKTKAYAAAQQNAITLTRAASEPRFLPSDDQEEQSRALQTVMEKESPVGLFTAGEIKEIQQLLSLPEGEGSDA